MAEAEVWTYHCRADDIKAYVCYPEAYKRQRAVRCPACDLLMIVEERPDKSTSNVIDITGVLQTRRMVDSMKIKAPKPPPWLKH